MKQEPDKIMVFTCGHSAIINYVPDDRCYLLPIKGERGEDVYHAGIECDRCLPDLSDYRNWRPMWCFRRRPVH
jgi:hypothetical protein